MQTPSPAQSGNGCEQTPGRCERTQKPEALPPALANVSHKLQIGDGREAVLSLLNARRRNRLGNQPPLGSSDGK